MWHNLLLTLNVIILVSLEEPSNKLQREFMQMQILITSMLQVSVVCSHLVSIHHANVRMHTVLDLALVCENPVVFYEHINVLWSVLRFTSHFLLSTIA